jgi:ABC-type nitrate/sulfonate/bicarbonate transport system ATPase subunit
MSSSDTALEVQLDSFAFPGVSDHILRDVGFRLGRNERIAIMGASASGKTTLLKICAGLRGYGLSKGACTRSGRFSMLFQDNVLLDYLSVRRNIALPSALNDGENDIVEISRSLHIEHLLEAFPRRLSGGERKRVALARGLAYPDLSGLIMDEPFVALDLFLKESILVDLKNRLDKAVLACLFSTHSAEEAVYLADRIIILGGTPSTIAHSIPVDLPRDQGQLAFQEEAFQRLVLKVAAVMRSMNMPISL